MEVAVPDTPEYSADTTFVRNCITLTLSKFLHVRWNIGN